MPKIVRHLLVSGARSVHWLFQMLTRIRVARRTFCRRPFIATPLGYRIVHADRVIMTENWRNQAAQG